MYRSRRSAESESESVFRESPSVSAAIAAFDRLKFRNLPSLASLRARDRSPIFRPEIPTRLDKIVAISGKQLAQLRSVSEQRIVPVDRVAANSARTIALKARRAMRRRLIFFG